jgi:hypothetical protein
MPYSPYNGTMKHKSKPTAWSDEDRQAFADRNFLKAQTIPDKRKVRNRNACRGYRPAFGN